MAIEKIKPLIIKILKKEGIKKAGIFGSYARGEQKKNSDVDIIIEPRKGMGFDFFGMQVDLEEALKKKVEVITYKYIHPLLKERILKDEIRII
ncbi:nucleotidyltransferase family protein [Candidatus Pacearchaeota archaeon]|nr:nucleotidyltransferase family protein [Candidatus Pacearchaeota archaeon]